MKQNTFSSRPSSLSVLVVAIMLVAIAISGSVEVVHAAHGMHKHNDV
jgi:hypothetical protein